LGAPTSPAVERGTAPRSCAGVGAAGAGVSDGDGTGGAGASADGDAGAAGGSVAVSTPGLRKPSRSIQPRFAGGASEGGVGLGGAGATAGSVSARCAAWSSGGGAGADFLRKKLNMESGWERIPVRWAIRCVGRRAAKRAVGRRYNLALQAL
jgi:hypothetical protein